MRKGVNWWLCYVGVLLIVSAGQWWLLESGVLFKVARFVGSYVFHFGVTPTLATVGLALILISRKRSRRGDEV